MMGQPKLSSQNGANSLKLVLPLLIIGLLIGTAWGPAAGATPGPTPLPTSQARPAAQASVPPGGLGLVPSSPDKLSLVRLPARLAEGAAEQLPAAVDLSGPSVFLAGQPSAAGVPEVGDQGQTNTCTGWATSYYYKTYQEWLEHQWSLSGVDRYDHIFSPSFVYNQITIGPDPACSRGAQIGDAMWLITTQGDLPYREFPWNPYNCAIRPTTAQKSAALEYKGINFGAFFISVGPPYGPLRNHNLAPLKQWLADNDPFVLAFPVYSEFDNYDCFQVVGPPANPYTYRGLHAVAVVGYDNTWAGAGGFKVVNSYGKDWGCYGYGWLSYEFVRKYAWEAWWMTSNRPPWIEPRVPDRYSPTIGGTIMVDLTPYENDWEDIPINLKWYVEGADRCTVSGQGSSNDVLFFHPSPSNYTGYDEITLVLRDSDAAEARQQLTLGWFDLDIKYHLPLGFGY